jgi:hypothetical protein
MSGLHADRVREVLDYDLETGQFTWRVKRTRVRVGDTAGYFDNGHRKIRIDGANYHASRLAFLWMTGEWPSGEVDHIDHNTKNNRWSNLRKATRPENQRNRTVREDSSTGFKGVRFQRSAHGNRCGYYVAQIGVDGKRIYLGSFKTAQEAHAAYVKAAAEHHGDFART